MCEKVRLNLVRGLTSIVTGEMQLKWPLGWRFPFFLVVCQLRRRPKIVKPPATKLIAQ